MAVIGVGQIGGSVALGARVAGAVTEVVAWSRTREKLERAQALGIIDRAAPFGGGGGARRGAGGARDAGAQPGRRRGGDRDGAGRGRAGVRRRQRQGGAIAAVEPQLPPGAFVACHPIAGTERFGPDAASPLLFEGKRCVVCPTPRSREEALATVERLWTAMGAEPVRMDAELHDRVFGAGSHLPHVAAYALAAALGQLAPDVLEGMRRLPTTSLRDTTRVAASSPAMWRDILLDNRAEVLPLIEALAAHGGAARRGRGGRRRPDRGAADGGKGGARAARRRVTGDGRGLTSTSRWFRLPALAALAAAPRRAPGRPRPPGRAAAPTTAISGTWCPAAAEAVADVDLAALRASPWSRALMEGASAAIARSGGSIRLRRVHRGRPHVGRRRRGGGRVRGR